VWHSLLVYLDSCPFLPLFTWEHWFELAPHVLGSWRVGELPGNYGAEEWQTLIPSRRSLVGYLLLPF
jgi:hypothetical protein